MKFVIKNWLALCILIGLAGCQLKKTAETESGELETDGMELAMRQQFKMIHDPYLNIIPAERLEAAKEKALINASARITALAWTERGPNNIGGRTRAIIVDKADATGNTVFAGSVSGGIFKTTNFLSSNPSWAPVNDKLANLAINSMVQDRNNPAIMYAGTGEGWFNIDAVRGAGIFKTTDGGTTWNQLASTVGFEYVQELAIDNNGNLYAALRNATTLNRGVMRSTDGGATWTQVLGLPLAGFTTGRAADLKVAPNGDIYAILGVFSKTQVMKSTFSVHGANTGALNTWAEITPVKSTPTQRGEIAIAPSNSLRLYLLLQDSATSQAKTMYRSSDGGTTWDSLPAPAALNNNSNSQTWFNLCVAVDPNNQDVFTAGGYHIAKSTDAGANFIDITPPGVHVDQHVLLYTSSSNLIVGNDGGIAYSTDANTPAVSFANKNPGYNVTQFYGADYHPVNSNYFLAGAQDNNTQKFTAAGINTTTAVVGGDGGVPHIDQTDGLIQVAATTGNNFYRSTDGGNVWSYMSTASNNRGQFINGSDYDDNLNTLYSGDDPGRYFFITNMGGSPAANFNTVAQIGTGREVTAVKVDPFSAATIWVGTNSITAGVFPVVLKISNANTTSPNVQIAASLPATVPAGAYISCVDVDPANGNHILVTLSNYGIPSVFESTDGGSSFNSIEGNLPDMPVYWGLFAPANAQLNGAAGGNGGILLGTELGVWTTSQINGTSTVWIPNSTGFPNVRTDMLKLRSSDYLLVAATHGRGLFTTTLPSTPLGLPSVVNTKNFIKSTQVSGQQLFIRTGNLNTTKMQIRLFDIKGRMIYSSDTRYSDQSVMLGNLPAASYILKIYGNKGEQYTWHFLK